MFIAFYKNNMTRASNGLDKYVHVLNLTEHYTKCIHIILNDAHHNILAEGEIWVNTVG